MRLWYCPCFSFHKPILILSKIIDYVLKRVAFDLFENFYYRMTEHCIYKWIMRIPTYDMNINNIQL